MGKDEEKLYKILGDLNELKDIAYKSGIDRMYIYNIYHKVMDGIEELYNIKQDVKQYIEDNSTNKYLLKSFDVDVLLEILERE